MTVGQLLAQDGVEAPARPVPRPVPALASLSRREREILQLLSRGTSTPEIASALSIAPATVRNHVQHLLRKLGVHTRTAAVALALRRGLT